MPDIHNNKTNPPKCTSWTNYSRPTVIVAFIRFSLTLGCCCCCLALISKQFDFGSTAVCQSLGISLACTQAYILYVELCIHITYKFTNQTLQANQTAKKNDVLKRYKKPTHNNCWTYPTARNIGFAKWAAAWLRLYRGPEFRRQRQSVTETGDN